MPTTDSSTILERQHIKILQLATPYVQAIAYSAMTTFSFICKALQPKAFPSSKTSTDYWHFRLLHGSTVKRLATGGPSLRQRGIAGFAQWTNAQCPQESQTWWTDLQSLFVTAGKKRRKSLRLTIE